ncbi:hypothetical protein Taro_016452, partial [Colocasia esculenta]|nr:hypothetical protein [Colocasia esculenta]
MMMINCLRDWQAINDALSCWVVSFQATVYPKTKLSLSHADFQLQLRQIIQVPIRREKFKSLCHMLVQLKVIANTISTKGLEVIQCLPHVISLLQSNIEELLQPAKVQLHLDIKRGGQTNKLSFLGSLTRGKDTDPRLTDSLSLILISLQLLQGNGSFKRQLIFSITMDVLHSIGHVGIDFLRIKKILSKLAMVVDFQSIVEEVTDCSFLYWRKEMMRDWLSMIYIDNKFSWLQFLLDALCDGLLLLDMGNVGKLTQHSYESELEDAVTDEIILPLCRDIENDLRLHVHSANLKGSVNVNIMKTGVRNLSWYLQLRPLCLPDKFVDIRTLVECYLNSTFYNHTAMALYNRKVYSEMRQLAELKYRLLLDDIHLPEHSSGQGFDLAEVLKGMCTFARNYSYNITKQIFIEKGIDGQGRKSLAVVGVEHVAAAIASHGLTTIDTASKNVVGFLTQKMSALSDILQDDILRSLLLKERIWKNEKSTSNKYPFTRAEQLSATMVKHPFRGHEVNIMDQLCCIITEMGNGLGLIRLLHTAASRQARRMSSFRWQQRNNVSFIEKDWSSTSVDKVDTPGENGNEEDENYRSIFDIDYFSLILSSVSKELGSSEYHNLVDFYFIIPAVVVSLIESKLHYKEKPLRRDREPVNQIIPDDGFVVGATCVLKVTGQDESFGELHWFASANKHLEESLISLGHGTEQPKESRIFGLKLWDQSPVSVSPETQKAIDRLKRSQKEMKLIEYGFNIARYINSSHIDVKKISLRGISPTAKVSGGGSKPSGSAPRSPGGVGRIEEVVDDIERAGDDGGGGGDDAGNCCVVRGPPSRPEGNRDICQTGDEEASDAAGDCEELNRRVEEFIVRMNRAWVAEREASRASMRLTPSSSSASST